MHLSGFRRARPAWRDLSEEQQIVSATSARCVGQVPVGVEPKKPPISGR